VKFEFRWIEWNVNHIGEHGVSPEEAEYVVRHPGRGYPRHGRNETISVRGRTMAGDYLQVVYLIDAPPESTIFVIHARPLNESERHKLISKRRR
jgi:hypothetical protein